MIKFEKISKRYKEGTVALDNISFFINKGEFVFLIGPSGAGKTTVFRLLLAEIKPTKGKIFISGEDVSLLSKKNISLLRRQIGAAFQDFKLLLDRTVFENVSLTLEILGKKKEEIKQRVEEVLFLVGLKDKGNVFPVQLSGGEFQRAVIARAIAAQPKILFADEPTGNLDPKTSWQIVDLLKQINKGGTTVIMATHNMEIVDLLKQRVIHLDKGKIIKDQQKGKYK